MKYINKASMFLIVVMMLLLSGCTDFLDVNDNPTKVKDASLSVLLPTTMERTSAAHYSAMLNANQVTHHIASYFGYYGKFDASGVWEIGYLRTLNQLKDIYDRAEDSPHYRGVARVLQAVNLGLMTGFWENIPYSEALEGSLNTTPVYDSQEYIYGKIFEYLDEAIVLLAAEQSFLKPGTDDMIYGGNLTKWTKLAYSLKARYLLHLSKKANVNWANIADAASKGFASSADNFQLVYNEVNKNPLHQLAIANQTGNFTYTFTAMFINTLKDERYGAVDPRLEKLVSKGTSAEYHGLNAYETGVPGNTTNIPVTSWYSLSNSPFLMMSFAELKLIEAEAKFRSGGDANTPYAAAVAAHMTMVGANGTDYMAHPDFALTPETALKKILREKYIALLYNPEFWNDMRRHDFDPNLFEGFVNVNNNNYPLITERNGPSHRALYPTSELNRNAANVQANFKEVEVKMWKDN